MPLNPSDLEPIVTYPPGRYFSDRLSKLKDEKQRVAVEVCAKFFAAGSDVFIGDGSSGFYAGLALLHLARAADPKKDAAISASTNNLALLGEFVLGDLPARFDLETGRGKVDPNLFAACGEEACAFARSSAESCLCTILSVNALFAREGPYGVDAASLAVKRSALKSDFRTVVLLADHTKLASLPTDKKNAGFPAFHNLNEWEHLMKNPNLWVFTTSYPNAPPLGQVVRLPSGGLKALSPENRYSYQAYHLTHAMGGRFDYC